jgi:hypothetical protein
VARGPKTYFLEHFTMQLRRESAKNLLEKLLEAAQNSFNTKAGAWLFLVKGWCEID